jgi:chromosome segregation ATPase
VFPERELASLKSRNEELERNNAELVEQCAGLASEVETLQSWLGRFKDSNVDHQSKEKDLASENEDLLRRLADLESRHDDFSSLRADNDRLESAYDELKSANDSLYSEYSDLQNRYDSLKFEYDLVHSERNRIKAEKAAPGNDEELKQLRLAVVDKDVLISDLESRLETENQAQMEIIDELKMELARLQTALAEHERKWTTTDDANEDLVSIFIFQSVLGLKP